MERGTYIAASGGLLQFRKLEVVNNNLANVNTPGFKKQVLLSSEQSFDATLASVVSKQDPYARPDHNRTPGAVTLSAMTDFTPGPIKNTGNPLDAALRNPKDFFAVQTPSGIEYTRAGNFTLNDAGELVTQEGFQIQGDGGPIAVQGAGAKISEAGEVQAGKESFGRLQVVRFEDTAVLERSGGNRFKLRPAGGAPATVEADVVPRSLEMANVSTISSVIDLITTSRAFEMYSKSAQTIDQMNQSAINQIGRNR